ncbi:MAG TPA: stage III sporulation protein AB [Candidatus Scatovicinus merdipullorum]|nr:stage III sporulation protein AB [Candidatus Scatovicinus merdipullorum]
MLRLAAVTAIILSGALTGLCASQRLTARVSFFEGFLAFLVRLQTQIRFNADDLSRLLATDEADGAVAVFLKECRQTAQTEDRNVMQVWPQAVDRIPKNTGLTSDDRKLLKDFSAALGTTDIDGQVAHCELYKTLAGARLEQAREEKAKKGKLYRMLGVFSGVCVSLLIL